MPLDIGNDIRLMDAGGVPRAEIARRLGVSRNTVEKYADMEDMSPAAPVPAERGRRALEGCTEWARSVLGGATSERRASSGTPPGGCTTG